MFAATCSVSQDFYRRVAAARRDELMSRVGQKLDCAGAFEHPRPCITAHCGCSLLHRPPHLLHCAQGSRIRSEMAESHRNSPILDGFEMNLVFQNLNILRNLSENRPKFAHFGWETENFPKSNPKTLLAPDARAPRPLHLRSLYDASRGLDFTKPSKSEVGNEWGVRT